jgi:phosphatidylglycerophosphate synthase
VHPPRAVVLALDPAAREPLLGLFGWQRALLAASHAGLAPLALLVPDEATAAAVRPVLDADLRLRPVPVHVAGGPDDPLADPKAHGPDLVVIDGAAVLDREAAAGLAEGAARGLFVPARASRREKRRALLRSLANPRDGLVDTWVNRPISRWFTRALAPLGVSPNAITVASALLGLAGAALLATGRRDLTVAGALLFQLAAAVDCTDGEVARVTYRSSPIGAKLDVGLDNVVHVALFACLALGARGQLGDGVALAAGASAVLGNLICCRLVWRHTFHPERAAGGSPPAVKRLLDRLTNRDFSLAVIAAALVGRLDVLLLVAAVGTHLFWVGLLVAARQVRR